MRAFVRLREMVTSNRELARRFRADVTELGPDLGPITAGKNAAQLEARLDKKLNGRDAAILSAIRERMNPPEPKRQPIGFTADIGEKR